MIISLFQVMSGLFHFFMKTMTIKYFITQEIKTKGTKSPDLYYTWEGYPPSYTQL